MKWRWFWESPPPPPSEPVVDPRVVHEAARLDAGLSKLKERVVVLGKGESMAVTLDETLRALKQ